jgi:uroporphyrinogen decarboxylase
MTSKDRVLAAVAHRATARVPITFDAEKEVYAALYKHFGIESKEALFDRLHCDTWLMTPRNYIVPASESAKEEKTSIWGWKSVTAHYSGGTYEEVAWNPLAGKDELADIDRHNWPTPANQDYSQFPAAIAAQKERAIIAASSWGAYFIASFVRGLENLLIDFATNEAYAERLIRTIADRILAMMENMLTQWGKGIDIVYMADDYCSQQSPLFSPGTFKRFVVPYLREAAALAHKHGKKFLLHVCGAVRPLLPMIIECGVDMLEPIQVRAEGMEASGLKRDFGRHICFYGGVDLQQVLCRGTPKTVAAEVRRLIDILGDGGGYVLGPGHTYIQVDAPIQNILAMYEAAYEYRRK